MKRIHFFYFLMILTCRNAKQNKLWNKSWQCLSLEFQTVHKNYFPIIYTVCGLYCVSLNSDLALWPNILHRPCVSGAKVALEGLRWLNSNCSLAVDQSTKIVLWVMLSNKRSSAGQPVRHLQKTSRIRKIKVWLHWYCHTKVADCFVDCQQAALTSDISFPLFYLPDEKPLWTWCQSRMYDIWALNSSVLQ